MLSLQDDVVARGAPSPPGLCANWWCGHFSCRVHTAPASCLCPRPIDTLRGHTGGVLGVAWSGASKLVDSGQASARPSRTSTRPFAMLDAHLGGVRRLALTDQGT